MLSKQRQIEAVNARLSSDPEVLWEVSFVNAERRRLSEFNDTQSKVYDTLIEISRRDELLKELSLQQLSTMFLLALDSTNDPLIWNEDNLGKCFLKTFTFMKAALDRKFCPHYYMQETNILAFMNSITLSRLKDKIRHTIRPSCGACSLAVILKSND